MSARQPRFHTSPRTELSQTQKTTAFPPSLPSHQIPPRCHLEAIIPLGRFLEGSKSNWFRCSARFYFQVFFFQLVEVEKRREKRQQTKLKFGRERIWGSGAVWDIPPPLNFARRGRSDGSAKPRGTDGDRSVGAGGEINNNDNDNNNNNNNNNNRWEKNSMYVEINNSKGTQSPNRNAAKGTQLPRLGGDEGTTCGGFSPPSSPFPQVLSFSPRENSSAPASEARSSLYGQSYEYLLQGRLLQAGPPLHFAALPPGSAPFLDPHPQPPNAGGAATEKGGKGSTPRPPLVPFVCTLSFTSLVI